ncbi:MAG: photosynthetic complex putative assembly protein PuhB [Pseudomonadota bacterium]
MRAQHEHEFEAAPGLPEPLPAGEQILWQGTPDWRTLAIEALHVRKLALYFAAMWGLQAAYLAGQPSGEMGRSLLTSAAMAAIALVLLSATAWFAARSTLYTLTNKRVVMRVGIVLTLTFNLPLSQVAAASLRMGSGGKGDVALRLKGPDRIAWLHLWPHARPWALKNPEPSLRCLADASAVGALVQQAWQAANPGVAASIGPVQAEASNQGQFEPARHSVAAST